MSARKRVAKAVKRSRTIFGSLGAAGALVAHVWNEAISAAMEAASQVALMGPVVGLATHLGLDVKQTTFWLALGCLALSVFARLDDARTGENSK
jgi:hypothetical protein